MFTLSTISNRINRRYSSCVLAGFAYLSFGYLLRGQISSGHPWVALFLGVFPNLFGSFATPFLLALLVDRRAPTWNPLDRFWVLGLINLFTFAVCLLIEQLHAIFQLGYWDSKDIIVSIVGGIAALLVFILSQTRAKSVDGSLIRSLSRKT